MHSTVLMLLLDEAERTRCLSGGDLGISLLQGGGGRGGRVHGREEPGMLS